MSDEKPGLGRLPLHKIIKGTKERPPLEKADQGQRGWLLTFSAPYFHPFKRTQRKCLKSLPPSHSPKFWIPHLFSGWLLPPAEENCCVSMLTLLTACWVFIVTVESSDYRSLTWFLASSYSVCRAVLTIRTCLASSTAFSWSVCTFDSSSRSTSAVL